MKYYLQATSEEALMQALEAANLYKKVYSEWDEEGNPIGDFEWQREGQYDLDTIGTIYAPTGTMLTGEDGDYPEMAALAGYHANIRGITAEQAAMLPTINAPTTPYRKWAGE